jgi:hypothetical protein
MTGFPVASRSPITFGTRHLIGAGGGGGGGGGGVWHSLKTTLSMFHVPDGHPGRDAACCNHPFVRDPEGALIRMHEGITGRGDLSPGTYGWSGPVARIQVARG